MNNLKQQLYGLWKKFRMWGVKGAVDCLLRQGIERRERQFFLDNARLHPHPFPERGITIVGDVSSKNSLPKVLCDFAFSLKASGIPFQVLDIGNGGIPASDLETILTPPEDFEICRFTHSVEMIADKIPNGLVNYRSRIVFWEFNEGVGDGYPCLWENDDAIVAMSDFNYEYFQREFGPNRTILKILYPLRIDVSHIQEKTECREKFGINSNAFVVFYNFSYSSGWWRKNPDAAVRAFARAFRSNANAMLVFKTSGKAGHENLEERLLNIAKTEGVSDRLALFGEWMTQRDLYELTNCCDVYLSLHRAEGFGLGCAEAMCLSKAVVATDYSATTEFCKPTCSIPVPYELVDVPEEGRREQAALRFVRKWAEPDIDAAAEALRRLYNDETLRFELGRKARDYISKKYSIENFRKSVLEFLECGQASRVNPSLVK